MHNFTDHLSYLEEEKIRILIYRCGKGENVYSLAKKYPNWTIIGFDNSSILVNNIAYYNETYSDLEPKNARFEADWEKVKEYFYDFVLCDNSFANTNSKQIEVSLNEIHKITTKVVIVARELTIDRKNTWGIIANSKFGKPQEFYRNHQRTDFSLSTNIDEVSIGIYCGDPNGT